jgi:VWFA-related protein
MDAEGSPVRGLTREDFEIYENGVRQDARTFTALTLRPHRPRAPSRWSPCAEQRTCSTRVYVLVLDDLHTHPLHANRVKRAVRRFLDEHMASNDRVALVPTSGRIDASQKLTSSRVALLAALDRLHVRKLRSSTLERIDRLKDRLPAASHCGARVRSRRGAHRLRRGLRQPRQGHRPYRTRHDRDRQWRDHPVPVGRNSRERFVRALAQIVDTSRRNSARELSPGAYIVRVEGKPRASESSAVSRAVAISVRDGADTTP